MKKSLLFFFVWKIALQKFFKQRGSYISDSPNLSKIKVRKQFIIAAKIAAT